MLVLSCHICETICSLLWDERLTAVGRKDYICGTKRISNYKYNFIISIMAVYYDIYPTPHPKEKECQEFHVRAVLGNPKSDSELLMSITHKCTITPSDIKGVLSALSDFIKEEISEGRRVHLDGIGYFYPTLTCGEHIEWQNISARKIELKNISFRAEMEILGELKREISFCAVQEKKHSQKHTIEDIIGMLNIYFEINEEIDRNGLQKLCCLTRTTSLRYLRKLMESGYLIRLGTIHAPRYTQA